MTSNIKRDTSLFFSDIVGYSKMIADDEAHSLNLLDEHDIILKKYIIYNYIMEPINNNRFNKFEDYFWKKNKKLAVHKWHHYFKIWIILKSLKMVFQRLFARH